jgi:hypothetical protein
METWQILALAFGYLATGGVLAAGCRALRGRDRAWPTPGVVLYAAAELFALAAAAYDWLFSRLVGW